MNKLPAPTLPGWLAALLPFDRYLLDVGGQQVHVMEAGDPRGRPVRMLHGNPSWGFLWRKVATELAGARLRLIMPDLVGLGLSSKPRDPAWHTIDAHGEIMARLIDELRLENLVFACQDWGGACGLRAFVERPGKLGALVLLNTVVGPPRPGFKPTGFHKFARMPVVSEVAFRVLGFPQNVMWPAQGDKRSIRGGEVARAYRWPLRGWKNNVAPLALARMVPDSDRHPSIAALQKCQAVVERFTGPAAIVWGDRDPVLGRVRTHMERLLPRARVTRTQAGHFLQEEVPREIADAVRHVVAAPPT